MVKCRGQFSGSRTSEFTLARFNQTLRLRCLDVLFPRICQFCGDVIDSEPATANTICDSCRIRLYPLNVHFCPDCGNPAPDKQFLEFSPCHGCHESESLIDGVISIARYEHDQPLAGLILGLKHAGKTALAKDLASMMVQNVTWIYPHLPWHALAAVPLHIHRKRKRGFNQTSLIAQHMATQLKIPYYKWLLRRIRPTRPQSGGRKERAENVSGAFRAGGRCDNARILLVDDVYTTGATTLECARILSAAGASAVTIATCAWVPLHLFDTKGVTERI